MEAKGHRYGCFLICFCLFFALLPLKVTAAEKEAAETEMAQSEVVRGGWYEDAYHITGENGERSGYGYEYEQAVAVYTGWKYEYVEGGWSELLEIMQRSRWLCWKKKASKWSMEHTES